MKHALRMRREQAPSMDKILARIRAEGGLKSSDFESPEPRTVGWWGWKDEKIALELLFARGDLMVRARQNFQRIYDLRKRVLPEWDDSLAPDFEEARAALLAKALRALGVARPAWVAWSLGSLNFGQAATRKVLEMLADGGELARVAVEGWDGPLYMHAEDVGLIDAASEEMGAPRTALLSPFDPVMWDRARALELFGFDYKIECYTPAPQRKYGYFTLPILHGDELVGRLDPKAHRKEGVFEVKSVHLEPGVRMTSELVSGLRDVLQRMAAWHGTPEVVVGETVPPKLRAGLVGRRSARVRVG
jgi:uncharacterized protein YcaQ